MLFDPETAPHLKPWLVRTLEPICDAEPGALADYILALLKHNAPESDLRKELTAQLEEFLEKECSPFIDTLFTALRTKSYLPYSAPSPPPSGFASTSSQSVDAGIPIPLDSLLAPTGPESPERGTKRSLDHDARDARPAKGPRLSNEDNFFRYGRHDNRQGWSGRGDRGSRMGLNGRADYMDGGMNSSMEAGMGAQVPARGVYRPPTERGICRDYHNHGYCARGAYCKYSHGDDAVIPNQLFPMNGSIQRGSMPYMPMMSNGNMGYGMGASASNTAYDPHERMDMRPTAGGSMGMGTGRPPNPRAPVMPRDAASNIQRKSGELPVIQDLTPELPPEEQAQQSHVANGYGVSPAGATRMADVSSVPDISGDVDMPGPMPINGRGGYRRDRGGPPASSVQRGTFGGDVQSFGAVRPEKRNDKTLVVEKIPEDKLSLGSVNEWFSKFGTVTNVAVDTVTLKALVSFAKHDEALAAWRSEDAVFGNRFVKVFWHRPMEGHGQKGVRMLAASAPLVANITKDSSVPAPTQAEPPQVPPTPSTPAHARKPSTSATALALAAKQQLLQQQIAEQKSLMAKLSTASPQEKKEIMARLRKLNEEMKPSSSTSAAASQSPAPSTPAPSKISRGSTPRTDEREQKERERLDKELELHHAVGAVEGEAEESTEELQAKLAKLKAEAASLGLTTEGTEPQYPAASSYRPYRGRGRGSGRSYYRGAIRGGPPRSSLKLDNRPKKLLVKGASSENSQAVRDWYETTGMLDSIEQTGDGDFLVSFKSRAGAEQGLAKGSNIATVGPVQVTWFTGQQSINVTTQKTSPGTNGQRNSTDNKGILSGTLPSSIELGDPHQHRHEEEEVIASGWGGDDGEDGFGML